ncbi:MAG: carbohydrate kinase family protein [Ilumatobacteraceae bacterium]
MGTVIGVVGAIGDVVEDIVVRLATPVHEATDTAAHITRRRGGSAANVAVSLARAGHAARFIGQFGDDATGRDLLESLRGEGVDVIASFGGRTGAIIVLLDHLGERTMLTDRGACTALDHPDPSWLDGLSTLHVPAYSLVEGPLARTSATLIEWAHQRNIIVSVDASSSSVIRDFGVDRLFDVLVGLRPTVLLCNEREAADLGAACLPGPLGALVTVIKKGASPAVVLQPGADPVDVPALRLTDVTDTTGAGDAFAAGFLTAFAAGSSPPAAAALGHESAARAIRSLS